MVMTMMMPMMMIIIHNVPLRELHHHACIRKSRSNLYRSFRRQQPEHTLAYARLGSICVARPAAGDVSCCQLMVITARVWRSLQGAKHSAAVGN